MKVESHSPISKDEPKLNESFVANYCQGGLCGKFMVWSAPNIYFHGPMVLIFVSITDIGSDGCEPKSLREEKQRVKYLRNNKDFLRSKRGGRIGGSFSVHD